MTASTDRRAARRRPSRGRWLRLLLAITILTPLLSLQTSAPPTRADDLSDALAQQQKLAREIADQKKQMAQLSAMQGQLQTQIAKTRNNLASVNQSLTQAQADVANLQKQISTVQAKYAQTLAQLASLESQLRDIEIQEAAKQRQLDERKAALAKRIVSAYEASNTSMLEQLLEADSLSQALSDVSYYMDISAADKALGQQIEADQRTLAQMHKTVQDTADATSALRDQTAAQKKQLDGQLVQLNQAKAKLQQLQAQIQRQLAEQRAAEAKLASNKAALNAAIKSNGAAQAALAKKIDAILAAQASRGGIPSQFSGSFMWPMGGAISQEYGCTGVPAEPPLGNCAHFHQGIDLVAPCGTPIHAAADGEVIFVGYNPYDAPPAAWIVIIGHASNLATWYAHMAPSAPGGIYQGAHVAKGQTVGWEASTGHSTGCHLHWAVRLNGQFVNPRLFV